MKKTIIALVLIAVLTVITCACAEEKPADTITYARYGESTAAESRSEESEQTEATNTEPMQTDKQTETEPEPVVDPDEIRFIGFSPLEDITAPVDINGLDLSLFDADSVEYAIYNNIGRLAVISRELKLYDDKATELLEMRQTSEPDRPYQVYVYEQCFERAREIRRDLRSLIYAFNVSEYEGTDDIEGKYSSEYLASIDDFKKSCFGKMNQMQYLCYDRSWQQDMLTTELKTLLSICGDLSELKNSGVSYGEYIDGLIEIISTVAEDLSVYCDTAIETMMDPEYPYEYKIERALYDDSMMLYIYVGDDTRFLSYKDIYPGLPSSYTPSQDVMYSNYNEEAGRYEVYCNYSYIYRGVYFFGFQSIETGLTRQYVVANYPLLKNMTHLGDYTEEKLFDSISPAMRKALLTAYDNYFDLITFSVRGIILLCDGEYSGISEIILSAGVNEEGPIILADIKYDEPLPPLSFAEIKEVFEYTRIVIEDRKSLTADKGTLLLDYESAGDMFEYTELHLYGYNDVIARYKDELKKAGVVLNEDELEEEWEVVLDDSFFLAYFHSGTDAKYTLNYIDKNGKRQGIGLKFDLNFELVK